jgi:putative phosphoribosyl transferase
MHAAVKALRHQRAGAIVVAVPIAASETCDQLRPEVDDLVCGAMPRPFHAVGLWYDDFSQTTDEEVRELLERSLTEAGRAGDRNERQSSPESGR